MIGDLKGLGTADRTSSGCADGSWSGILEIPAGVQTELYEKLNATHEGRRRDHPC